MRIISCRGGDLNLVQKMEHTALANLTTKPYNLLSLDTH